MHKPKYWDFHTNDGMHNAMQDYAKSFNKPSLVATVKFEDGSEFTEEFEHATKEVYYRVFDKEEGLYSVSIHTAKYREPFFSDKDLTQKELKQGFLQWLEKNNKGVKFTITWNKGE